MKCKYNYYTTNNNSVNNNSNWVVIGNKGNSSV